MYAPAAAHKHWPEPPPMPSPSASMNQLAQLLTSLPVSVWPSQLSSKPLPHTSGPVGWIALLASSQSPLPSVQITAPSPTAIVASHQPSPSSSQPSSVTPLQLSSTPLHASATPGRTVLSPSLQSVAVVAVYKPAAAHKHCAAEPAKPAPSTSLSTKYATQPPAPSSSVAPLQSSSTPLHVSDAPGCTFGLVGPQSCGFSVPSPSMSGSTQSAKPSLLLSAKPWSVTPLQSSSKPLQVSVAPGWTEATASSQSLAVVAVAKPTGAHVQMPAPVPKPSLSVSVKYVVQPAAPAGSVAPSQSSSMPLQLSVAAIGASHAVRPLSVHFRAPLHVPHALVETQLVCAPTDVANVEHVHSPDFFTHCLPAPAEPWTTSHAYDVGQSAFVAHAPPQK